MILFHQTSYTDKKEGRMLYLTSPFFFIYVETIIFFQNDLFLLCFLEIRYAFYIRTFHYTFFNCLIGF